MRRVGIVEQAQATGGKPLLDVLAKRFIHQHPPRQRLRTRQPAFGDQARDQH